MKKTLKLMREGFVSSTGKTPEFMIFARTFKSELKKELKSIRATNIKFSTGHFYISGFYTISNQAWYFSISDIRWFPDEKLLYRTADNYQDYTGGTNQYVKIETGMALNMKK